MRNTLERALPWAVGFFLVANVYALPGRGMSPRATDLLALFFALTLLIRAARHTIPAVPLAAAALTSLLPVVWIGLALLDGGDSMTVAQGARWVLAVPLGMTIVEMMRDERSRSALLTGLVLGCWLNFLVIFAQHYGVDGPLQRLGMSNYGDQLYWVGGRVRLPGMHGAPSSASAVMSLVVPVACYLYLSGRRGLWFVLASLAGLAISLHMTSSRSPLLMSVVSGGVVLLLGRHRPRAWALGSILLAVGLPVVLIIGPPGGWARWADAGTSVNAEERFASTIAAAEISLRHPLGLGVVAGKEALMDESASRATHNAFLQASLFFGTPLALLLLGAMLVQISRLRFGFSDAGAISALLAVHVSGLFLFEEHLNNPTFVVLSMWLIAEAAVHLSEGARRWALVWGEA